MPSAAPTPDADRRSFRAGDLGLELELPAGAARRLVVLVPGLFATSAFFRVDADAGPSPARWLRDRGSALVHFDPRGVGRNHARARGPIDLALRVADLGAVVAAARALLPHLPLVLLGHSFGGATIYALVADNADVAPHAIVTVGSPARLVPREPPWEKLFTPETERMATEQARSGWVDALAFAWVQNKIYSGRGNWRWLPRGALAFGQWAVARSTWFAESTLARPRVASFLYRAGAAEERDYTPRELQRVLRSKTIEREHLTLLVEILKFGRNGGGIALRNKASLLAASARSTVPALAAFSDADELVLRQEVEAWASPATSFLDVGACGHGGYFFKPGPRQVLLDALDAFLDQHAG